MKRHHVTFSCEGETLVGTLDTADGEVGLLIVSGGSEPRSGAFGGHASLASRIAARGFPVFRFDRRGVGDSSGTDAGFRQSQQDIRAALACFRGEFPAVRRIVAYGNCDGAAALMLGEGFGVDALALANPWTFDDAQSQDAPPDAIKARYLQKLRNPREVARLLTGKISIAGVAGGVRQIIAGKSTTSQLGQALADGISAFHGDVQIMLAGRDRTAQAFHTNYPIGKEVVTVREGADHGFSEPSDHEWLEDQIVSMMKSLA
ncbi:hydrolase 1, exosortase A system-associated [Aurantiacibacter rhizosphaerae]|uniref:Hydrolase 1, exosortase A system-associated n=1 Tax=Aurantiacibacter rhizosphaerae TaxID=2691582 RepID=A0A844XDF7_9SPHN|nr:hydrolase 1, exosortase A system-associated [Aurantiacibacter rhizosphaerae]MWV27860.1 hydrolase 1, exosortase A system-associated [Aurantiacibacter rhizosphaerae]